MAVTLNRRAYDHAKELISEGRFVYAVPGREIILCPGIIIEIGKQGKMTSFVIVPPHYGLGTGHCSGIECAEIRMARKDGIAEANNNQKPRRHRR